MRDSQFEMVPRSSTSRACFCLHKEHPDTCDHSGNLTTIRVKLTTRTTITIIQCSL